MHNIRLKLDCGHYIWGVQTYGCVKREKLENLKDLVPRKNNVEALTDNEWKSFRNHRYKMKALLDSTNNAIQAIGASILIFGFNIPTSIIAYYQLTYTSWCKQIVD